ncbi:MAG: 5-oxoprolinase/urea amidolyase family protein [Actinobacteria bacterium]|nr:5-oxoprolinase/urea amidolyase family protein [Actinomycetota bacterium]
MSAGEQPVQRLRPDAGATRRHFVTAAILATPAVAAEGAGVVEVLAPGTETTVQDVPGRIGYWPVGVPPSGPMDALSFRLANRAVANPEGAPALECTASGPTLRFADDRLVCVTGADMGAALDGEPIPSWVPVLARAGAVLTLRGLRGPGLRSYVAIEGGIDVPAYLGSASTFTLGGFGGHQGRSLVAGDRLLLDPRPPRSGLGVHAGGPSAADIPQLARAWTLAVLEGPHAAPDFFTAEDIDLLYASVWTVHHNSNRTGVRLIGPKPRFARSDGGDAGLHPSNIHDNGYAVGTVDFTGDMPILLGPDGPSLGGFVCPATIVRADLWKLGQLAPGDTVRLVAIDPESATDLERRQESLVRTMAGPRSRRQSGVRPQRDLAGGVLLRLDEGAGDGRPSVTYRRSGDRHLLVEYGPMVLDLALRCRVHALERWLGDHPQPGVVDATPGIRSLLVQLDSRVSSVEALAGALATAEDDLGGTDDLDIPGRIVHLPLSWDDPSTREAIARYMATVREDAPWCPWNIEFIRRINGLDSVDDVHRTVFGASYLVLGLGDVYLGAPVATPLDPRHRLVTTKYNPARTWTPENAVGIGGAYLCVYGMEGPGGYQFVGRTVPVWSATAVGPNFEPGVPWLLRQFDQLRFHPVSAEELVDLRHAVRAGTHELRIELTTFSLGEHRRFLAAEASSIEVFRRRQQEAFNAERGRWRDQGEVTG